MKTKFTAIFCALAAFCLAAGAPTAGAATISLGGRIQGHIYPYDPATQSNTVTIDFYWIDVPHDTSITINWCVTNGPGGNWGTSIDLHAYTYVDPYDDLFATNGIGAVGFAGCNVRSMTIPAGRYLFNVTPRNGGFDGGSGVSYPNKFSDSDFFYFDYAGTITGDVVLTAIWRGQADNTFLKVNVPEPGAWVAALVGLACLFTRRQRARQAHVLILLLAAGAALPPAACAGGSDGLLEWDTTPGMGYRVYRKGRDLTTGEALLPEVYYGTGNKLAVRMFDPPPAVLPAPVPNPLLPYLRLHTIDITAYWDGRAIAKWNDSSGPAIILDQDFDLRLAPPALLPDGSTDHTPGGAMLPGRMLDWIVPALPEVPDNPATTNVNEALPAVGPFRVFAFVWMKNEVAPDLAGLPPLTASQRGLWEPLKRRRTGPDGLRAKLAAPPAPPVAPPVVQQFGSHVDESQRAFLRIEPYYVDSDGDGYSDSGEIAQDKNPYDATSSPRYKDLDGVPDPAGGDMDGDGFTDMEEKQAGTDAANVGSHPPGGILSPYLDSDGDGYSDVEELAAQPVPYDPSNPGSHPAGAPVVRLNDLVITEFMLNNDTSVLQKIGTETSDDDWVEIYNPTDHTIALHDYYLTDRFNKLRNWFMDANGGQQVHEIGPRQFLIVMADKTNGQPLAEGNGFLHANFDFDEFDSSPPYLAKDDVIQLARDYFDPVTQALTDTKVLSTYWIKTRRSEDGTFNPPASVVTPRDMYHRDDESYGVYAAPDGTLKRGLLRAPTPGRHNSEGYLDTLLEPDFIVPGSDPAVPVAAGLRDAPPLGGLGVQISHPLNRDADPNNDVTILYTTNCAEPTEFSEIVGGTGANCVTNGDFSQGVNGWFGGATTTNEGVPLSAAQGQLTAQGGRAIFTITNPGTAVYHLVVGQPVAAGQGGYVLEFQARSLGAPRTIGVGISTGSSWEPGVALDGTLRTFTYHFDLQDLLSPAVFFVIGGAPDGVEIDNVTLRPEPVLHLKKTTVLRAFAVRAGWEKSPVATRSYIFKTSVLGTAADGSVPVDAQARPAGYPEATDAVAPADWTNSFTWTLLNGARRIPLRYEINASVFGGATGAVVISGGDYATKILPKPVPAGTPMRAALSTQLDALPSVCLSGDVSSLLDVTTAGAYANSGVTATQPDPIGKEWERTVGFEIIDPTGAIQQSGVNVRLEMSGDSSLAQDVTRKHSFRVKFGAAGGPAALNLQLFPGSQRSSFKTFRLKNPMHNSWATTYANASDSCLAGATYCNEGWARDTFAAMGYKVPQWRWVHLYLNGLYWGVYQLTERIDEDWLKQVGLVSNGCDIIEPPAISDPTTAQANNPVVANPVDGGRLAPYTDVVNAAAAVAAALALPVPDEVEAASQYATVASLLDVDQYIDYLILNSFALNGDWPMKNWKAYRSHSGDMKFRFLLDDSEMLFRSSLLGLAPTAATSLTTKDNYRWATLNGSGATQIHGLLKNYSAYKAAFSARLHRAFEVTASDDTTGALAKVGGGLHDDRVIERYRVQMARFLPVLDLESARWGNLYFTSYAHAVNSPPYKQSDWNTAVSAVVRTTIRLRRNGSVDDNGNIEGAVPYGKYLTRMQDGGLYTP